MEYLQKTESKNLENWDNLFVYRITIPGGLFYQNYML